MLQQVSRNVCNDNCYSNMLGLREPWQHASPAIAASVDLPVPAAATKRFAWGISRSPIPTVQGEELTQLAKEQLGVQKRMVAVAEAKSDVMSKFVDIFGTFVQKLNNPSTPQQ